MKFPRGRIAIEFDEPESPVVRTLQEVADMLGVTQSAIYQCEQNALRKLFCGLRDDPEVQAAFRDLQVNG